MEFFQCVPMGPDGGAPGASRAYVGDAQGLCMLLVGEGEAACVFPGEACAVRAAVRTAERCRNGVSEPAGDMCECSNGGTAAIYISPGIRSLRDPLTAQAGTGGAGESGAAVRYVRGVEGVFYAGYASGVTSMSAG